MKAIAVALLVASGCTYTARQHASRIMLGAAVITLACDWGSTRHAASEGWPGMREANPLLGEHPSTARIDAYMVTAEAATIVLGLLLPEKLRPFFLGAVLARETYETGSSYSIGLGTCGMSGGPATTATAARTSNAGS